MLCKTSINGYHSIGVGVVLGDQLGNAGACLVLGQLAVEGEHRVEDHVGVGRSGDNSQIVH